MNKNKSQYYDETLDYVEYIGISQYVVDYEPESVAKSYDPVIRNGYMNNISPRMCAIILFVLTIKEIQMMISKEVKQ